MKNFISTTRFYSAFLFRQQKIGFLVLLLSIAFCVIAGGVWAVLFREHESEAADLQALLANRRASSHRAAEQKSTEPTLPTFDRFSSSKFNEHFHTVAREAGITVDEVAYSLDATEGLPYLRYRLTLSVKTRYVEIRKFLAALASEMPGTTLDSIRCARANAGAPLLTCDLAFSAFFAKN